MLSHGLNILSYKLPVQSASACCCCFRHVAAVQLHLQGGTTLPGLPRGLGFNPAASANSTCPNLVIAVNKSNRPACFNCRCVGMHHCSLATSLLSLQLAANSSSACAAAALHANPGPLCVLKPSWVARATAPPCRWISDSRSSLSAALRVLAEGTKSVGRPCSRLKACTSFASCTAVLNFCMQL